MSRVKITVSVPAEKLGTTLEIMAKYQIPWTTIRPEKGRKVSVELAGTVFRLAESGHAVRDISRRTGVSKSTVSRIHREPEKYGVTINVLSEEK